jgi:hypothetical protein
LRRIAVFDAPPCDPGEVGDETAPQREYARQTSDPELVGHEDVVLDVPALQVDTLELDLSDLRARVSLHAEVLSLLRLNVGVDVDLGQARLDLRGVEAQALLKVRLENIVSIIDRLLQTIDAHPEVIEPMVRGMQETLWQTGRAAERAAGQIGAATAGTSGAAGEGARRGGQGARQEIRRAVQDAGRKVTRTVRGAAQDATQAVREAGRGPAQESRETGQGATAEAGQGEDRGPGRPDIEASAAVDAESGRREIGEETQDGEGRRLYRRQPRRARARRR